MAIEISPDIDPSSHLSRLRWPFFIAAFTLGTMVFIGARTSIVRAMPRTAVIFEAANLPVNLTGLALEKVAARIMLDGDRRILVVEGDIVNPGGDAEAAKSLIVSLLGDDGQTLYTWTTPAPQNAFVAGDRAAFVARLASPPTNATSVAVEFDRTEHAAGVSAAQGRKKPAGANRIQGSSTESQYR
ncbi:MAG: hypothetical protein ACK5JM_01665 [Rhodoblastus sp.]